MQKYQDVVLSRQGTPVQGAKITVTDTAGGAVEVYASNVVGENVNPVISDDSGRFSFYAADGRYNLSVSVGGNVLATVTDVLLEDPLDGSDAVFGDVTINGELDDSSKIVYVQSGTGATARNVGAKLSELAVSVTDFGADHTGTSTSTLAFQRARDAVLERMTATGAQGGVIVVPAGCKFRMDTVCLLNAEHSGIEIHAHGATIFKGVDSASSLFRFFGSRNKFLGGTLDGNTAAGYADSSMLLIYGDESVVRGVTFKNGSKNGLAYAPESAGDRTSAPRDGEVSGCWFFDNDGVGLSVASARGLRIHSNHFQRQGLEALTLDQGAEYISVVGNYFVDNNLGRRGVGYGVGAGIGAIGYDDGINLTVQGNVFLAGSNLRPAIRQGNAQGDTIGLIIQGNTIQNFTDGIDLTGTGSTTEWDKSGIITGNVFRGVTNAILLNNNIRSLHIGANSYPDVTNPIVSTGLNINSTQVCDLSAGQVKWSMRKNSNTLNVTGNGTLAPVAYDTNVSVFSRIPVTVDAVAGTVTIPVPANYTITGSVEIQNATGATSGVIEVQSDGVAISRRRFDFDGTMGDITMQITTACEFLPAGAVVRIVASLTGIGADTADFTARPLGSEFFGSNI